MKVLLVFLALGVSLSARAETIEFPDEELATESVLPVFDSPDAVKSRTVETARHFELGGQLSYNLTEAFFKPLSFSGEVSYHFNEEHGMNIFGTYFLSGVSDYTNQLNPPPGSIEKMNLQFAPRPKWLLLANYQYTGFYGKMSVARDFIMNLHLYGLAGVGGIQVGDKTFPVFSVGLGQKFYVSSQLALRFDLRALFYQGPDILSRPLGLTSAPATTEQSASSFSKHLVVGSILSVGAIWLIPNS